MHPNPLGTHWSEDPNAPKIPYQTYFSEKANFSGNILGAIFYGVVVFLYFQCMIALLNPINRSGEGVRWGLVAYTTAAFSFVTVLTAMNLDIQSVSYIDYREFPGIDGLPLGPHGYLDLINSNAINVIPNSMFILNSWLTEGLLLYRCCVIYATNYWVVIFPCLMYLSSLATGIVLTYYQASEPVPGKWSSIALNFRYPYFVISLMLNVLLPSMIVARLVLRIGNIRTAAAASTGGSGLRHTVVTMLVESFFLYVVNFSLFVGAWSADSPVEYIFFPILVETQVIAPFLIILRVANRRALTSDVVLSGGVSSVHPSRGESTGGDGITPDWHPASSIDIRRSVPDRQLGGEVETGGDVIPL